MSTIFRMPESDRELRIALGRQILEAPDSIRRPSVPDKSPLASNLTSASTTSCILAADRWRKWHLGTFAALAQLATVALTEGRVEGCTAARKLFEASLTTEILDKSEALNNLEVPYLRKFIEQLFAEPALFILRLQILINYARQH